jgi:prepilin-type N-terminal cleavage/methylation domain-containing protein
MRIGPEKVHNQTFKSKRCDSQRGLTLLELLLVVTILSAVAWMTLGAVSNNADQVRFEDTRNRLQAIRRAIIGDAGIPGWEKGIQGGFVVDNGRLPDNINGLVECPADYQAYGVISPLFDPAPDINGFNDGGETALSQVQNQLLKGHRSYYLTGSTSGGYRDGWGTKRDTTGSASIDCPTVPGGSGALLGNDVDADNHGWCVSLFNDGLYVDSYGMNGEPGTTGIDYEQDIPMSEPVLAGDWQINLAGASARIINQSGADIDFSATSTNVRASLLVFESGSGGRWRRMTTDIALDACLDGDGDGLCGTPPMPAPRETTATLPAANVPAGEHLLVLVSDPDGIEHTSDDSLYVDGTGQPVTGRVKFFSRGGVPYLALRIR